MARAATTTDAFNAVAEPRRRQIVDLLANGERAVGDLVQELALGQPPSSNRPQPCNLSPKAVIDCFT